MRNDKNSVLIKTERTSCMGSSRESIKENKEPEQENNGNNKRKSPDEGIQSATESDPEARASSERGGASKRSNSVEVIHAKTVEIDITSGDDFEKMPPPPPKKASKKTRTKQKKQVEEVVPEEPQPGMLRVTRSKIKQEKISIDKAPAVTPEVETTVQSASDIDSTKVSDTGATKKGAKKKYPMPILVKIENHEEIAKKLSAPAVESPPVEVCNATFNVPAVNETVTLGLAPIMNETVTISSNPNATVTIEKENMHDSLMTEDNDDEDNEETPLSMLKVQNTKPLPPVPALKLKKNEVFK